MQACARGGGDLDAAPKVGVGLGRRLAVGVIRFYQIAVSPYLGPACRFEPTCSRYAIDAIERYGLMRGGWIAFRRLASCRPLGGSGYDPVP